MAQKVGNLVVEMSANVARLQRDFNKATSQAQQVGRRFKTIFKGVGLSMAAGLSAAGLTRLVKSSIDAADAIAKNANKANIATGTYQELTFALDKFDVSQQQATTGLMAFTKRLGEARSGTGALVTYLRKYDQALLDSLTSAESNEQALDIFMQALGGVKNDADRAALAAAAFSRTAGVSMAAALKDGGVGIEAWRKKAKALGIVISGDLLKKAEDAKDQMSALGQVIRTRTTVAIAEIAPQISSLAESLAKVVPDLKAFVGLLADVAELGVKAADAFKGLNEWTGGWLKKINDNMPIIREVRAIMEGISKLIADPVQHGATGSWGEPETEDDDKPKPPPLSQAADNVIKQLRFEQEQLGRVVTEQRVYNELKKAGVAINSETGRTIAVLVRGLEQQKAAQDAAKDAAIAHSAALEKQAEDSQLLAIRAAEIYEAVKTPFDQFKEGVAELDLLKDANLLDPKTYRRAFNQLGADYAATVVKMQETTTELSEFTKEAFRSMQNVASDFFSDVLEGNFTDLGDSFRKMVNRMLADWASVKMMGGLFGEDFGKTGELGGLLSAGLGILGGAFSGGSTGGTGANLTDGGTFAIDPFPKRELGGPVMAGTTYLVGERGPELFMPQTSGNVVANNKLGGGTSISVPIGNIDGGSKQLLANLPNMIENLVLEAMRRYA